MRVATILFALAALTMFLEIDTVHRLPHWFWPIRIRRLDATFVLLFLAVVACGTLLSTRAQRLSGWKAAASVALLALAAQWSLALASGRGIDGMRSRAIASGHAEFARLGSDQRPASEVLRHYEEIRGPDAKFAPSKPPGQLLLFKGLSRIADAIMPDRPVPPEHEKSIRDAAHYRLVSLLTLLLPLGCALSAALLMLLARQLSPGTSQTAVGVVFILTAPVTLITLHFDQSVYPVLAVAALLFAARSGASQQHAWVWGLATGLAVWAGLFVTFSLLGVLPLVVAAVWTTASRVVPSERLRRLRAFITSAAVAFVTPTLILFLRWQYNPWTRYRNAMSYHVAYKQWNPTLLNITGFGLLDLLEFAWWMGPVVGPLIVAIGTNLQRIRRGQVEGLNLFTATSGLTVLFLAFFGRTAAEVARLWIFLLPAVALIAVHSLTTERQQAHWIRALIWAQAVWTLILKARQDFA